MQSRRWSGARWWKCDLHTHTPASADYGNGSSRATCRNISATDWLLDYMRAGIDCVAVTDHNSGAWIDELKKAQDDLNLARPNGYRPIHVLPGVEISVSGGIHLLAILGTEKSTADVDSLLGAVGYDSTKGRTDGETKQSFIEVAEAIARAGGIAIPAHVDKPKGLLRGLSGVSQSAASSWLKAPAPPRAQRSITKKGTSVPLDFCHGDRGLGGCILLLCRAWQTELDLDHRFGFPPSGRSPCKYRSRKSIHLDQDGRSKRRGPPGCIARRRALR